jgi:ParB-like chromosome segregation protein Spo0J
MKISKDLLPLALPIEDLKPLQKNPRKGNVEAIMSSYKEFGQMKPIVVRPEGDGTYVVIAGNHKLQAAKNLGWEKIAAVQMNVNEEKAVAFALADNRTMELGHTDNSMLNDMVVDMWDDFPELFEGLGWDEFELAAIEESQFASEETSPISDGYFTPVMVNNPPQAPINITVEENEESDGDFYDL